jgi:multidrug transporter EmrE-like cation transporter
MLNSLSISKPFQGVVLFLAVLSVAVADVMLKKASTHGNLLEALSSPWFIGAAGLYFVQISFFIFAFLADWKLSIIGALQTALYAIILIVSGVYLYKETLTGSQMTGIFLALSGVILINWP